MPSSIWGLDLQLRDNNGQNGCLFDAANFGDNVVNDLPISPALIPRTYVILRGRCPLVEVQFAKWPRAFPRQRTGETLNLEGTAEEAGVSFQIASISLIGSPSLQELVPGANTSKTNFSNTDDCSNFFKFRHQKCRGVGGLLIYM
jgi:hypothetical protein